MKPLPDNAGGNKGQDMFLNRPIDEEMISINHFSKEEFIEDFMKAFQPERLNPEDHIVGVDEMICDSPISDNK